MIGIGAKIPVLVVVPPQLLLLDVAGPIEVLRKANLEQDGVRFDIDYIGPQPTVMNSIGLSVGDIAPLPDNVPDGALVVLSGSTDLRLGGDFGEDERDSNLTAEIVRWLKDTIRPGVRVASICSGALLAARAGLLDGRNCTTHHAAIREFSRLAPTAHVLENSLFVEDGDYLTCAGVTAGIDLMLHIVAQAAGHLTALAVARSLVVYIRRGGADPQLSPWLDGRSHIHPAIHRAQDAVVADPAYAWSVVSLARIASTSPRNLSRLFTTHTGMGVADYVSRVRIALARELIVDSRLQMEAVAERVGFGSTRQFRRAWKSHHGSSPYKMRREHVLP